MTPAEALEELLPRWKASLPADFSAEVVDDFVRRKRRILEDAVGQALGILRLRRGGLPQSPADFTAVGLLAERERRRHGTVDKDLARRLKKRRAELTRAAQGADVLEALARRFEEYVLVRAEALLMGQLGWDAVPLLLRRPLLAVFSAGSVVIVHRHGVDGSEEAVFPGLHEESIADLRSDLAVAHEAATEIASEIGDHPQVVWARARGRGAAEIRRRAHVVCQRCGSRLREPGPHYAISTIECPGGEWLTAEEDAEEMQRRAEEARRRLAESPVPVFVPPDNREEKAKRKAEQQLRRNEREREKEEAARRREEKAAARAEARAQEIADRESARRFEAGELPRTADEFSAFRRFAARHYDRLREANTAAGDEDDAALLAWVLRRQEAQLGRRPDIDTQERVIGASLDYALLRAEAILLRALGHTATPLLVARAALLVEPGDTLDAELQNVIHRHFPPELVLLRAGEVRAVDYYADAPSLEVLRPLREAHDQVERLRREIAAMDVEALAPPLWRAAREIAATTEAPHPNRDELDAFYALIAPEPVDRFGRMVHETRWASRAAAIRQLERAGFKFIKGSRWQEGYWSRFPRTAVVKGATVQVTAAL